MVLSYVIVIKSNKTIISFQMLAAVLAVASIVQAVAYTPEALADKIVHLPGAENLNVKFNQFSGYLSIPGTSGENTKQMHYW
jgi:hypothetical protein